MRWVERGREWESVAMWSSGPSRLPLLHLGGPDARCALYTPDCRNNSPWSRAAVTSPPSLDPPRRASCSLAGGWPYVGVGDMVIAVDTRFRMVLEVMENVPIPSWAGQTEYFSTHGTEQENLAMEKSKRSYFLPKKLVTAFHAECRKSGYVKEKVVAAAILKFLDADPNGRAQMFDRVDRLVTGKKK